LVPSVEQWPLSSIFETGSEVLPINECPITNFEILLGDIVYGPLDPVRVILNQDLTFSLELDKTVVFLPV